MKVKAITFSVEPKSYRWVNNGHTATGKVKALCECVTGKQTQAQYTEPGGVQSSTKFKTDGNITRESDALPHQLLVLANGELAVGIAQLLGFDMGRR